MEPSLEDRQWIRITHALDAAIFRGALDADWEETKHPRAKNGQFGAGGSGGKAKSAKPAAEKKAKAPKAESKAPAPKAEPKKKAVERAPHPVTGKPTIINHQGQTPKSFWTYQSSSETPSLAEAVSAGAIKKSTTEKEWDTLSPGMKREILRSAQRKASVATPTPVEKSKPRESNGGVNHADLDRQLQISGQGVFKDYSTAHNEAIKYARWLGKEVGLEKGEEYGKTVYKVKHLPKAENRYGHELRMQVVRPNEPLSVKSEGTKAAATPAKTPSKESKPKTAEEARARQDAELKARGVKGLGLSPEDARKEFDAAWAKAHSERSAAKGKPVTKEMEAQARADRQKAEYREAFKAARGNAKYDPQTQLHKITMPSLSEHEKALKGAEQRVAEKKAQVKTLKASLKQHMDMNGYWARGGSHKRDKLNGEISDAQRKLERLQGWQQSLKAGMPEAKKTAKSQLDLFAPSKPAAKAKPQSGKLKKAA